MDKAGFDTLFTDFQNNITGINGLEAKPGQPNKPIVILVHGIDGKAEHWSAPLSIEPKYSWLFDKSSVPTLSDSDTVVPSPKFETKNADKTDNSWCETLKAQEISYINFSQTAPSGELDQAVKDLTIVLDKVKTEIYDKLKNESTTPPLILLCHSRGGLVARKALKNLKEYTYLKKVITLCTPHGGSYLPKLSLDYDNLIKKARSVEEAVTALIGPTSSSLLQSIVSEIESFLKNPPGENDAKATSTVGYKELIPNSSTLLDLEKGEEPWPNVSYYSVAGSVPAFVKFYFKLNTSFFNRTFTPNLITFSNPKLIELLNTKLPLLKSEYGGLAELDRGDSCVALERSKWPAKFNATHREFPIHHMEALIDPKLQEAVINLIQGKEFAAEGETLINEGGILKEAASSTWLEDPTISAIHDAFLLGWTNIELKSRIQIAMLDRKVAAFNPAPIDPAGLSNQSGVLDFLLKEVDKFTKESGPTRTRPESNDSIMLSLISVWRALFNRLAALHNKRFPDSTLIGTSYATFTIDNEDWPYLKHPLANEDISELPPIKNGNGSAKKFLENFALYDLTRHSLNCMSTLYKISDNNSSITDVQIEFSKKIKDIADKSNKDNFAEIRDRIVQFLESWDAYLREQFFAGGQFKNDITELTAYEAGRSLSSLSWSVSVKTAALEKTLEALQDPAKILQDLNGRLEILKKFLDIDSVSKLDTQINTLADEISTLDTEIDQATDLSIKQQKEVGKKQKESEKTKLEAVKDGLNPIIAKISVTDDKGKIWIETILESINQILSGNDTNQEPKINLEISQTLWLGITTLITKDLIDRVGAYQKTFKKRENNPVLIRSGIDVQSLRNEIAEILVTLKALEALKGSIALLASSKDNTLLQSKSKKDVEDAIKQIWATVFQKSQIIEVQHRVTALSTALDDAYYNVMKTKDGLKPAADDKSGFEPPNLELPSLALHSVSHSLDYWQRTVSLIPPTANNNPMSQTSSQKTNKKLPNTVKMVGDGFKKVGDTINPTVKKPVGTSEISMTAVNQLILDGDGAWCRKMRLALIDQSNVWQNLVSCQQSLRAISTQNVTEKILSDFMADLERAGGKAIARNLWVIIPLVLLIGAALFYIFFVSPNSANNPQNLIVAAIAGVGAIFGGNQLVKATSPATNNSGSGGPFANLFNSAGGALVDAFRHGVEQIQLEFAYLNYNITVAYPLVEFFISNEIELLLHPPQSRKKLNSKRKGNKNTFLTGLWALGIWVPLALIITLILIYMISWLKKVIAGVVLIGILAILGLKVRQALIDKKWASLVPTISVAVILLVAYLFSWIIGFGWLKDFIVLIIILAVIATTGPFSLGSYLLIRDGSTPKHKENPVSLMRLWKWIIFISAYVCFVIALFYLVLSIIGLSDMALLYNILSFFGKSIDVTGIYQPAIPCITLGVASLGCVCIWLYQVIKNKAPLKESIHNGYEFLLHVIWNSEERGEEIKRIARAAFGPVGGFVGTLVDFKRPGDKE